MGHTWCGGYFLFKLSKVVSSQSFITSLLYAHKYPREKIETYHCIKTEQNRSCLTWQGRSSHDWCQHGCIFFVIRRGQEKYKKDEVSNTCWWCWWTYYNFRNIISKLFGWNSNVTRHVELPKTIPLLLNTILYYWQRKLRNFHQRICLKSLFKEEFSKLLRPFWRDSIEYMV